MTHAGQIIPIDTIVEYVWGYTGDGSRELVRGLVKRLRSKVEPQPKEPTFIRTAQVSDISSIVLRIEDHPVWSHI